MKTVGKLLICSLIMVFGLLFHAKVFAGTDTVKRNITVYCKGKNAQNSILTNLSGCTFNLYNSKISNEALCADYDATKGNRFRECQANESPKNFTTNYTGTVVIPIEVKASEVTNQESVNPFIIIQTGAPNGYLVSIEAPDVNFYGTSNEADVVLTDKFINTKVDATIKNENNVYLTTWYIYLDGQTSPLKKCKIQTGTYSVGGSFTKLIYTTDSTATNCTWTSTYSYPIYLIGFPNGTYHIKANPNDSSDIGNFTIGSNNDNNVINISAPQSGGQGGDEVPGGDYGAGKSSIYLIFLAGSILLAIGLLIYVKKQKFNNNNNN